MVRLALFSQVNLYLLIHLRSVCSGYQISLILWGERAMAFDGEAVLQAAGKEPVVAIFVGTLVKPYEG